MTTYRVESVRTKSFPGYPAGTVGLVYYTGEFDAADAALLFVANEIGYDTIDELRADLARAERPSELRAVAL